MLSKSKQSVIAGLLGNALEWYDFLLYAYFAPLFATLFFPVSNPFLSLLATFGIFASGFVARPVGGFLLGRYGDSAGRRAALIASISIITTATVLMACLPTFAELGFWSPLLMTVLRLMQGIAIGGELTGSATFLVEHSSRHRKGLMGSLILSTAFFGMVIGSAVTTLVSVFLSPSNLLSYGWRLPYLLGGILGMIGIYLRVRSKETPQFLSISNDKQYSLKEALYSHRKELLLSFIFTCALAIGNYLLIAYVVTFLIKFQKFTFESAMQINLFSLLLLTCMTPVFGFVSDKIGRKQVLYIGLIGAISFTFIIFWLLTKNSYFSALLAELLLALVLAPMNAVVPVILVGLFPTHIRSTASAIAYNVSQAIFGGTVPLVALSLITFTNNLYAPGWYFLIFVLVATIAASFLRETDVLITNTESDLSYESTSNKAIR